MHLSVWRACLVRVRRVTDASALRGHLDECSRNRVRPDLFVYFPRTPRDARDAHRRTIPATPPGTALLCRAGPPLLHRPYPLVPVTSSVAQSR